jgi:4-amino-4-deoxy-L-arabinose transferase-like glycosyltransferase
MIVRQNGRFVVLMVVGMVVLGAGLGMRDPWPPDEPRFALIALDMARSGDWLIPRVGGVPYPDKPPLFFWIVAAFYLISGSINVALLLPAFLSGILVLWLIHDLARRLWNPESALWAGAALLVTLQFPLQMKGGQIDGFLCMWTTLGLYGLCRHLLLGPDWRWYAAGGFFCGLGVITKGVGFLPFLLLIPYAFAAGRNWSLPAIDGRGRWALAPVTFLIGIGVWLLPMLIATIGSADPALAQYRDEILLRQTVTRYGDAWGHLKPPWYFLVNVVPLTWFPISYLLPWLLPAWIRDLRQRVPVTLLLGAWVLLVLVFFSISAGKRSVYIFPAVPAFALLASPHLPRLLARNGVKRFLYFLALLTAAAIIGAGAYALQHPAALARWIDLPAASMHFSRIVIGIGLLGFTAVIVLGARRVAAGVATLLAILWIATPVFAFPAINSMRSGKALMDSVAARLAPDESLGLVGWKEQFLLQWNRSAVHFGFRRQDTIEESREAAHWLTAGKGRRLLLSEARIRPCFYRAALSDLGFAHGERWFLASGASVLASCNAPEGTSVPSAVLYRPS